MAVINISTLFGDPEKLSGTWARPVHETANRCHVLPGGSCCICVPQTASRVVVEMWGQGGGGGGSCCCMWPSSGGQGGSYAYKVWSGGISPQALGTHFSFCACVCTCDCRSYDAYGSPGQFSRLCMCNSSNWIGCVNGGAGGCTQCIGAGFWPTCNCQCNAQYDLCLLANPGQTVTVQTGYFGTNSHCAETGASCLCGGSFICVPNTSCVPIGFCVNTSDPTLSASTVTTSLDTIFAPVVCSCWDFYRLGACGFSRSGCLNANANGTNQESYRIGIGGAAYAGGKQQHITFNNNNNTWCGFSGNFPGGGGRGSAACSGGCCYGSHGGGGLILISWV